MSRVLPEVSGLLVLQGQEARPVLVHLSGRAGRYRLWLPGLRGFLALRRLPKRRIGRLLGSLGATLEVRVGRTPVAQLGGPTAGLRVRPVGVARAFLAAPFKSLKRTVTDRARPA